MKIRLYDSGYSIVPIEINDEGTCFADNALEYMAVSEIVEVDFPMLDANSVNKAKIKAIDERISMVQADCEVKVNQLKDERQKLLAIGHDAATLESE